MHIYSGHFVVDISWGSEWRQTISEEERRLLHMPAHKVLEHRIWQVDGDDIIGREAATPFFDASGNSLGIAELPDYQGGLHIPL